MIGGRRGCGACHKRARLGRARGERACRRDDGVHIAVDGLALHAHMYAFPNRTCVRSISGAGSPISGRIIFINARPNQCEPSDKGACCFA